MTEMPPDPFEQTPLVLPAAVVHELFTSYVDAGFTEMQALYLAGIHLSVVGRFSLEQQASGVAAAATRSHGTLSGDFCQVHTLPLVWRMGERICLACEMGVAPPVAPEEFDKPIEALFSCAICGGPMRVAEDGVKLVCPHHPPPEDPPPSPPRHGGLGPHNLGGG